MADERDDRRGGGADPAARALLSAVPDAFMKAAAGGEGRDPRDPPAAEERAAGAAPPDDAPPDSAESLMEVMARAQLAWLGGGLRYWGEMAELLGRRGARIADIAGRPEDEMSERDRLRLLDEARGWLREVGEVSLREAQALNDDMQRLERALRRTQEKPPAGTPRRHGRPSR